MLRQRSSRFLAPLGFVCALVCTPHCAVNESPLSNEPMAPNTAEDGVILSAATWTLGWNTDGVEFDAEGGFSLTTNLGYRVHVTTGNVILHRVALIPCATVVPQMTELLTFSVQSAFAHEEDADPSSMETLAIADVVHPKPTEIGANAFTPVRYCQVYWLVARGMPGAVAQDGLDLSNRSIYFEGTWERKGESGPVLVDTWWPAGVMTDIKEIVEPTLYSEAAAESSVHFGWIGIDLALGRLFDDLEFVSDSDAIIADSILDNIIAGAALTVDLQSP